MKQLLCCVLLAIIGSHAVADEVTIDTSYVFTDPTFLARDTSCIAAMRRHIFPQFRGLKSVAIPFATITDTSTGSLALYPDTAFSGEYGDASGTINCLLTAQDNIVTDVGVSFNGLGLGGFERRGISSPSRNPADWKVGSFSTQPKN